MSDAVCPICKSPCGRHPDNPSSPFCSGRCKLADLGNWLDGRYALPDAPAELLEDDELDGPTTLH
jgi:hypothetical protein